MNTLNNHVPNIAISGQWLVGSLLRFVRFAHFTTQATHQLPLEMLFRISAIQINDNNSV